MNSSKNNYNNNNNNNKSKRLSANEVANELKKNDSFLENNFDTDDSSSANSTVSNKGPKLLTDARVASRQSNASINKTKPYSSKLSSRKSSTTSSTALSGDWLVKIYTSDLKGVSMEGTNANVYIALIGYDDHEAEKVWLTNKIAKSKNKDLFEAGKCDEFLVAAPNVKKLKKIRIGVDNTGFGAGWHLNKVEVVDQRDATRYFFECNKWLSRDEDDGAIERILIADDDDDDDNDSSITSSSSESIKSKSKNTSLANSIKYVNVYYMNLFE